MQVSINAPGWGPVTLSHLSHSFREERGGSLSDPDPGGSEAMRTIWSEKLAKDQYQKIHPTSS